MTLRGQFLRCILVSLASSSVALAGGFQVYEFSTEGEATVSSNHLRIDDASIAHWNPAGMVWLPQAGEAAGRVRIAGAGHVVSAQHTVDVTSARAPIPPGAGTAIAGDPTGQASSINLLPNFHVTRTLGERYAVGVSVTTPFGLPTTYDNDWAGRYFAVDSKLVTINLNPSVAVELTPGLSLGVGLDFLYARATLSNAIDLSTACLAQAAAVPAFGAVCAGTGFVTPGSRATDGLVEVEGDDLAVGWNAAVMWKGNDDRTRIGLSYRSSFEVEIDGDADFELPATLPAPLAASPSLSETRIESSVTLPATASLAFAQKATDKIDLYASLSWTDWSQLEEVRIRFANGAPDGVTPFDWEDSYRVALGARYQVNDRLDLLGGIAFDDSPVTAALRNPRIPDADKYILGIGASYKVNPSSGIDVAYSRVEIEDTSISLQSPTAGTLSAQVEDANINVFSAQYNHVF